MKKKYLFIIILMMLILCGCSKNNNVNFNETNTVRFHDLILEIPKSFVVDKELGDEYIQFYSYDDDEYYNSCMMHISVSDYPQDDMKEVVKEGLLGKTNFAYNEKNINGYNWSVGYIEEGVKYNQTYYAINNRGKEYSLSYDDFGSGDECAEALKVIEKSLKFN